MKLLDPNIYEQVKQSIIKKLQNQNLFFSKDKQNIGKLITQTKLDEIERAFDLDIGIHFDFTYGYTILDVPKNVAKVKVCFIYIHNLRVWNLVNNDSYDCKNLEQEVNFELYRAIHKNNSERIKQNVTNEVPKIQIMEVSLKKAFSLLDGRLSTSIEDVYKMLNYIFDENLFTHQLPEAINIVKQKNPEWFKNGVELINKIKQENNTNDFEKLMNIIDEQYSSYTVALSKINEHIDFTAGLFPSK